MAFNLENVSPLNWDIFAGVPDKDMAAMELGLAHSLSRYKLKFSPDKIDTMIVQVERVLRPLTFLRYTLRTNLDIPGPGLRPLVFF